MKKIFTFEERVMNGTVTASSSTVCFATRELAEKARRAVIAANKVPKELGFSYMCSDIKETNVFESEDEVLILREEKKADYRPIRFRGKDLKTGEWLYGSHYDENGEEYILPNLPGSATDYEDYQVDPNTVGQFTGLTDEVGNKIWEGDVFVRDPNIGYSCCPYCVRYQNGSWVGVDADGTYLTLLDDANEPYRNNLYYIKVIGNIHDNPSLMEQTAD